MQARWVSISVLPSGSPSKTEIWFWKGNGLAMGKPPKPILPCSRIFTCPHEAQGGVGNPGADALSFVFRLQEKSGEAAAAGPPGGHPQLTDHVHLGDFQHTSGVSFSGCCRYSSCNNEYLILTGKHPSAFLQNGTGGFVTTWGVTSEEPVIGKAGTFLLGQSRN